MLRTGNDFALRKSSETGNTFELVYFDLQGNET